MASRLETQFMVYRKTHVQVSVIELEDWAVSVPFTDVT